MRPQKLLRVTPHHIFDCLGEARRVLDEIALGIGGSLDRNLVLNLDTMMAAVRLAHDERGNYRRARHRHHPRESAGGRRRLAKEWHPYGLAAFGILIEGDADHFAGAQSLQYGPRGGVLAQNLDPAALAREGHQRIADEEALGMMDQA